MKKVKEKAKLITGNPLLSGSAVMIVGSNVANAFAYIYHLLLGRTLGPTEYGELVSLLSVVTMVGATFGFIGLVVVKFVSASKKKDLDAIFSWFMKRALVLGAFLLLIPVLLNTYIADFLHLDGGLTIFLGPLLLFMMFAMIMRSFLQGQLQFTKVVISVNLDQFLKLTIGVGLVYLGYAVWGAMFGLFVSTLSGVVVMRFFLRKYSIFGTEKSFDGGKEIFLYSVPIFIISLALNSFYTTDVILVKHFFGPENASAGIYGALSTMGKITFFGTAPVGAVMFPLISKKHSKGEGYLDIFFMSVLIVSGISIALMIIYYLFPEMAIKMLYGSGYVEAKDNLLIFSLFMGIVSLVGLFTNYFLSIQKTKVAYLVLLFSLIQIGAIWVYHSSIYSVVMASIYCTVSLLACLLIYFVYDYRQFKKEEIK